MAWNDFLAQVDETVKNAVGGDIYSYLRGEGEKQLTQLVKQAAPAGGNQTPAQIAAGRPGSTPALAAPASASQPSAAQAAIQKGPFGMGAMKIGGVSVVALVAIGAVAYLLLSKKGK